MLRIGQKMSDLHLETTEGDMRAHEYFNGSWGLMVCYEADFSAVCAGELKQLVKEFHKFKKRNVKILGISCDSVDSHVEWIKDLKIISGIENDEPFPFPIVSDTNRILTLYLNVLDAKCIDKNGIPVPCRGTIVLTPDMHIQLIQLYPQEVGRNFGEILRAIDALQLTTKFSNEVFTPCGWEPNTNCIVSPKVSDEDIENKFSSSTVIGLPSGKSYMRIVPEIDIIKNFKK